MPNLVAEKLELNGMLDAQAMHNLLDQAAGLAHATATNLAVLTLDFDHFKAYQDDQGRAQAESVLMRLAELLKASLPAGATLAHLSGDEFVVVLPATDLTAAAAFAEGLRAKVEVSFANLSGPAPLTVTLGVAASPAGKDWTARSLLSLADARMTFAKKRLLPHHNLVWAGTLPSDWYTRLDVQPGVWPSL